MFIEARPLTIGTQETLLESTERTTLTPAILRAQNGDRKAFEELYREHVGRVYAVCIRICGDRVRAEELTQDVFVRTWQMLPTFRGESVFSSWLHRLAVNVVLVDYRAQRRRTARVQIAEDLEQFNSPDTASAPGDAIDLEDAVRQLPPQARAIFVLHDIEGYKHEEIAEQLELAVGTCKAQLHRARKLLKEVLEQ